MAISVSTTEPNNGSLHGGRGGDGDQYELVEAGGSRASDEVSDDDEPEKLAMGQMMSYGKSTPTRRGWYERVRGMLPPVWSWTHRSYKTVPKSLENKAESHKFFNAAPTGRHTKRVYGLLLGLTLALALQTARLSADTANEHTGLDQPMNNYVSDDFSIPLEGMYPASMVLRRPPPPFDESTIVVENPTNAHEPAWRLSDDANRLPKCGRFVLTPLVKVGLGANLNIIFRAAMIAKKLGVVHLVDNNNWSYGRLEYYLEPYTISCVPPHDWHNKKLAASVGAKGWKQASRIMAGFFSVDAFDEVDAEFFFDQEREGLQRLQDVMQARNPKPSVLPASDTLPPPLIPAFEEYARILHSMWKPVPAILKDVERVKAMMGIGGERPTIAVQVRLGDKAKEYRHSNQFTENTFGNLTAHLEVMHALYDRMVGCPSTRAKPCYPLSPTARHFPIDKRPRAILLTIEDDALENMARDAIAPPFEFDRTPAVIRSTGYTFTQHSFNRIPLKARVASGRALVRDLILAAKETDATVVTMGSNLGRLLSQIAGVEAMLGPPAKEVQHAGGRIRSLDTPWYPTTWADGIWTGLGKTE
ncbi:BQ2448_4326 [Microbotryum intermedium]|uniref:BQ2448_4322 protein n=1 Tax=Microbotryum intermedium TaxID=269621 RepID=A0A238FHZ0_9BASI|nr:BQ2448_4322 [Microbotryum intermedium]SCV72789.1 BQ2448_4326 [Microbotryum intermedium]